MVQYDKYVIVVIVVIICGETKNTPLEGLRTPLSLIIQVLEAVNDGMSINAAWCTLQIRLDA